MHRRELKKAHSDVQQHSSTSHPGTLTVNIRELTKMLELLTRDPIYNTLLTLVRVATKKSPLEVQSYRLDISVFDDMLVSQTGW